ncbi:hypothetical protein J3E72DRAFT_378080 [Bipolaris maydis]|uniref:uncharacterized protein n=1 Tax=Cochliobolus heterostrophus TaxID=5016 RepID=UPI0024CFC64B|nr:hypothetical protein BM1_08436 [Bipolaris maydis]KAJ5024782.1 hypothetical protein J3E73DRAFT_371533 [Bipolaris maydis]KAJ5032174.1 hypothetical protein J3E74DRAFT_413824 [Bipolaris maydis]KAJ5056995.1 hypothetical protein J3E74DRAFT_409695 [Bipolaris maydis]KAJ6194469.1 hypothetical protein J3E72DRAFT_378080 [Bipolaris maydis]
MQFRSIILAATGLLSVAYAAPATGNVVSENPLFTRQCQPTGFCAKSVDACTQLQCCSNAKQGDGTGCCCV